MPMMLEKLYDALRSVNVPDDKARAAAIEATEDKNRLSNVESDLRLLKWMVGFNLATTLAVLWRVFQHGAT
jgi:hypothetical protein